ncbi:MAG TPA: hypothetical protein VF829_00015 [Candidatus Paceibacterota bacterium]
MGYAVTEIGLIALFAGFLGLTEYEAQHGVRIAPQLRASIDRFAGRVLFIVEHVDFAAFLRDTTGEIMERIAHDIAHLALQATRFVERQLTRIVRYFRARFAARRAFADAAPSPESSSSYVRAIADFKQELRNSGEAHSVPSE